MSSDQLVPALMFMTLAAVLVLAVVQLMAFLKKRRNRNAATRAFYGSDAAPSDEASRRSS